MEILTDKYRDVVKWDVKWMLEKFWGDDAIQAELFAVQEVPEPGQLVIPGMYVPRPVTGDILELEGNLLTYGGASTLWECLIGNGTATGAQTLTFFNNGNAQLGVGDSTTAAAASQTDLQAVSNKLRKGMDSTYPTHTDGTVMGAADIVFRSTFATGDANFAWEEVATFNRATSGGRMLNRKVSSLGTKTSAGTWVLTETITLA